jgi:hypothetical protein
MTVTSLTAREVTASSSTACSVRTSSVRPTKGVASGADRWPSHRCTATGAVRPLTWT